MPKTFRFLNRSGGKAASLLVLITVLVCATVGTTVAYIAKRTMSKPTTYTPAEIEISSWTYGDAINAGDSKIYVRASIVAAWVSNDDKKTVWAQTPVKDVDYELTIQDGWFIASDGFYYHEKTLNAAQSVNFVSAKQIKEMEGFSLKILVLYSGIQSVPTYAVEESWPAITVKEDGTLKAK